jgi:hypothetical protein
VNYISLPTTTERIDVILYADYELKYVYINIDDDDSYYPGVAYGELLHITLFLAPICSSRIVVLTSFILLKYIYYGLKLRLHQLHRTLEEPGHRDLPLARAKIFFH